MVAVNVSRAGRECRGNNSSVCLAPKENGAELFSRPSAGSACRCRRRVTLPLVAFIQIARIARDVDEAEKMAGPGRRVIRESGRPEFLAGINDPIASLMPRGGHIRDDVHV